MKFVCMKCESFMLFQKVEQPAEQSLGVMFECPKCGGRFAMVTNPGETQLVSALGVKLGGRTAAPEPFELTTGMMKEPAQIKVAPDEAPSPASGFERYAAHAATSGGHQASGASPSGEKSGGSCPFSSMLSGMAEGKMPELKWAPEAEERMARVPDFVRPMVKMGIEAYARRKGYAVVTPAVIEESKSGAAEMEWTPGAEQRLANLPEFIRPMARREIERMAAEAGDARVTEATVDKAREKFAEFMGMTGYMG